MQIVEVIRSLELGGSQKLLLRRLGHFSAGRHDTLVINTLPRHSESLFDVDEATLRKVKSTRSNNFFISLFEVLTTLRKMRPDMVVVHSPAPALGLKLAVIFRVLSIPVVEVMHSVHVRNPIIRWASVPVNRAVYKCIAVSKCVAASPACKGFRKVQVIYGGVPLATIRDWVTSGSVDNSRHSRELSHQATNTLKFLFCGRLSEEKNPLLFLDACMESSHHQSFTIIGEGPLEDAVRQHHAVTSGRVSFLGPKNDGWKWIAASDVLVLTSQYEGLGVVAMEALAAGVPIVGPDIPGLREIVEPGYNGLLIQANDSAAWAKELGAMFDLISGDAPLLERLSQNAFDSCTAWDSNVLIEDFYNALEELEC